MGRTALVTGGSSGIGRLVALGLAQRGAKVAVWDLNQESLARFKEEAAQAGFSVQAMICDVSKKEDVYARAKDLEAVLGPLDILVNNAGVVSGASLLDTPDEKIMRTMDVNVLAHFWTVKAFLPGMIKRNRGHIVSLSSAAGLIGVRGLADYSASKFAVFGFHEALRTELARLARGIDSLVVCPFFIDTGMFAGVRTRFPLLLPILRPEYAARRILSAIAKGKKRLIMPRFVYTTYILRLLPVAVMDAVSGFFGVNRAMDHFRGR